MSCMEINGEGFRESRRNLSNRETLELEETNISDSGLKYISELSRLRVLFVGSPNFTDSGLTHLSKLKNLELLYLVERTD